MRFFKSSHRGPACRQEAGFTLIELLVVMAVMSILVGVGVNTFTIAQKKARDAKRKADLRTIQIALEAYKLNTGNYPRAHGCDIGTNCYASSNGACNGTTCDYAGDTAAGSGWIAGLEPNYVPKLPTDPRTPNTGPAYSAATNYAYTYGNVETTGSYKYDLLTRLEDKEDAAACGKQSTSYLIATSNPGGSYWCNPPSGATLGGGIVNGEFLYVLHNQD